MKISGALRFLHLFAALSIFFCVAAFSASPLVQRYPGYEYVFKEFDIGTKYMDNPAFVRFVTENEEKYMRFYTNSVQRGKEYIPLFRKLLISQGLSHLFVYLSMTESGFQSFATSPRKAAGLWQFMSATARRFDLKVNDRIDERYNPVASTRAAMRYIRTLYSQFGKWYLVMMAYNCGEGRLRKAIVEAGTDDFEVLMDDAKGYIPRETRRYLQKILLLSMMGERIKKSDRKREKKIRELILPDSEVLVNIYGGTTLGEIASLLRMDIAELSRLNPHISHLHGGSISEDLGMTQLFIPREKFAYYKAFYRPPTLNEIYRAKDYAKLIAHIVKEHDTLRSIARRYGCTPLDLIIANQLADEKLKNGTVLMIPVTRATYEHLRKY